MTFRPSKYSQGRQARRNWSKRYPESSLTVGSQAGMPIPGSLQENASLLSDFLARIPFPVTINSAYRSPSVNASIPGASSSSQHMNALAVDIQPPLGMPSRSLATWFWLNRWFFPSLDQVIVYAGTNHLHVGICPPGATGCSGSRWSGGKRRKDVPWLKRAPQFLQKPKKGPTVPWVPSPLDLPQHLLGVGPVGLAVWATLGLTALGAAYYYQDDLREMAGV